MLFKDAALEALWNDPAGPMPRKVPSTLRKQVVRRLQMLEAANSLSDLLVPPGNRLEALRGDRRGQYSICVNDRWRICFAWRGGEARGVELVDYH